MKQFSSEVETYTNELKCVKQVVRCLDENLLLKYNKSSLLNFENNLKQIFISRDEYETLKSENAGILEENKALLGKLNNTFDKSLLDLNLRIDG